MTDTNTTSGGDVAAPSAALPAPPPDRVSTTDANQIHDATDAAGGTTENRPSTAVDAPPETRTTTRRDDAHSLRIKPEYVLDGRDPSLPALLDPEEQRRGGSGGGGGGGRKKKRARKIPDDTVKLCGSVVRGTDCPFGEKCRFSHDVAQYLKERPEDLPNLECPYFQNYGCCPYGVSCRLGSQHISKDGANICKDATTDPPPTLNGLPREVQDQLRRRTYAFVCKRHNDTRKDSKEKAVEEGAAPVNFSPLPAKEVKLIDFSNKVYVAPLTTVGNLPFRRILKRFGVDITCGEMALCSNLLEGKSSEWALLKRHASEDVFGVQLAAGYPDLFTRACELVERHASVDFVDMNLGCPIDLLCNKGCGASLMLRDKRLEESVRGMTATLGVPVTIKMRTGWDAERPLAHVLARKIHSWGFSSNIAAIMIHGRSRLQRYSRLADWEYVHTQVAQVSKSLDTDDQRPIPVIGNGDIFSYTDYERKVLAGNETSGLSTCAMLARGALIKPWLATEIKERRHWDISATERLDILKDFVNFGLEHWGTDQQGINNVRRFLLEWLSFLHRYVPVGLLEVLPQEMNHRAPPHMKGRNELETLFLSPHGEDWIRISEMLLGPVPDGFRFEPKHKASG